MIQYSLTSYLQFNIICSYIYDGWNLIREKTFGLATEDHRLQTAKSLQSTVYSLKSYFWGLDVSGSLGGAGGVGGLLQLAVGSNSPYISKLSGEALAKERQKTDLFGPSSQKSEINNLKLYFPHYDHIGNIIAYTNESEEIAAVYDYSGFGELIRSDGPMKEDFSLQFSTKYIDKETNLYYYGYRFYNPKMGNWLSRESMGESESVNLYTFINNDSINAIDVLGLYAKDVHFYLNYYMARYIGLDKSRADTIATAAQYVDVSPETEPFSSITARHKFHFPSKYTGFLWLNKTYRDDPLVAEALSKQNNDIAFGVYLHIYEDTYAHEGYGKVFGHAHGFYDPDRPWLHRVREKEMARHVYEKMTEFAKSTGLGNCKLKNKSFEDFWNKTKDTLFVNHYNELRNKTVDTYVTSPLGGVIKSKQRALSYKQISNKEEEMRCDDWQDLIKKDFKEDVKFDEGVVSDKFKEKFNKIAENVPNWHENDK